MTVVVLQRLHDSEGVIGAGTPLLVIGDPRDLEVVTDLLSTDAVRVQPGATATLEGWGGESRVAARVRRVEPSGFTKVSTLGVEEQRVNVVLELVNLADAASLGDGYRVDVRIVLWQAQDVLKVPTSALFRAGAQWAAYAVSGGRAVRTGVRIGHQTSTEAEVLAGLDDNAAVIVHPGDLVQDGGRVRARTD